MHNKWSLHYSIKRHPQNDDSNETTRDQLRFRDQALIPAFSCFFAFPLLSTDLVAVNINMSCIKESMCNLKRPQTIKRRESITRLMDGTYRPERRP